MTAWLRAALVRAVKTFAQAFVAAIGVSGATAGIEDINWPGAASVAALAAVISLLTSVAGLPEVDDSPGRHAA